MSKLPPCVFAAPVLTACALRRHVFGLKGDVTDNIHYVDENHVVYPVGNNTVLMNTEDRKQKFINGTENTEGITALAVTPSKRYGPGVLVLLSLGCGSNWCPSIAVGWWRLLSAWSAAE